MSARPFAVDHAYVVPAFGESPHLEACLSSLAAQTRPSPIVVSTSTPRPHIERLAHRYGARYCEHGPNKGIGHDWNAALDRVETDWVTIAHQDDIYLSGYGQAIEDAIRSSSDVLLVSTDYAELSGDEIRSNSRLLAVKKILIEMGYLGRGRIASRGARRRMLSLGCPIACPAVSFSKTRTGLRFDENMRTNLDWDAWTRLADLEGAFVHVRKALIHHRVHDGSETSAGIKSGARAREDLDMFNRFWPPAVAGLIARAYALSYQG